MGEKYPLTGKQYERYHEKNIRESALFKERNGEFACALCSYITIIIYM